MNVKIFTVAHVPESLQQAWLQHLRDFDAANPGCHFEVGIDGPDEPVATMIKRLTVEPGLTFTKIFERAKWSDGDQRGDQRGHDDDGSRDWEGNRAAPATGDEGS